MATITIRNLDEGVKLALRRRAAEHGVSLEAEVRQTLREAVSGPDRPKTGAALLKRMQARFEGLGDFDLEVPPRELIGDPPDFS